MDKLLFAGDKRYEEVAAMPTGHQELPSAGIGAVHRFLRCVVKAYCETAPSLRSPLELLKLIEMYRPLLSLSAFPTPLHYGLVLAKVTDHLLQFFGAAEEAVYRPIGMAAEAEERVYIIYRDRVRVLLWQEEEEAIRRCKETAPAVCQKAAGFCPCELECCFLWTGGRRIEWISA
ncbi:hypothetical protein B4113_0367 [Geobacillus sp. B4113_201601]|nr:hypothetical protein B4113_0367 [Geobacillus sp. B4113_201601]